MRENFCGLKIVTFEYFRRHTRIFEYVKYMFEFLMSFWTEQQRRRRENRGSIHNDCYQCWTNSKIDFEKEHKKCNKNGMLKVNLWHEEAARTWKEISPFVLPHTYLSRILSSKHEFYNKNNNINNISQNIYPIRIYFNERRSSKQTS